MLLWIYLFYDQIFKRLNSYSKNPLYMGLKEYGRIIKSIFILRYIDDEKDGQYQELVTELLKVN